MSALMIGLILEHRVTHLIAVSSLLDVIARDPRRLAGLAASELRTVVTGGEVCDPKLIHRWLEAVPDLRVLYGYGPTEFNSLCMNHEITQPEPGRTQLYPIGKPFPGVKAVLLDAAGGVIEGPGQSGVLALAGPQIMSGYWGDPARTREVLRRIGDEDYYYTGDHCVRDEDSNYHFVGRTDDEVKIRGRRINLNEVRNSLLSHEHVSYAIVTTLAFDTERRIVAFAQVDESGGCSFEELDRVLRSHVPPYMLPEHLCIGTTVNKTSTNKVDEKGTLASVVRRVQENPGQRHLRLE